MRHKTITNREQSQVVKLVVFQVIATIATSTVFLVQTGGAFTRDWYMTGGFLVINGAIHHLARAAFAHAYIACVAVCQSFPSHGSQVLPVSVVRMSELVSPPRAGMMVDLFVITVLVQGYQLPGVLIPQFIARHFSPPLTQYEADLLMAPKGDM